MRAKSFLRLVVPLLLVVMLLPLGLSRPIHAQSPVQIVWATEWTDDATLNAFTKLIIEPFQKAHPNITIKIERHNGAEGLDRDLKAEIAAGAAPDIFDTNGPGWVPPYIDAKAALNLDKYAEQFKWKEKMIPYAYQAAVIDGHLYSLSAEVEGLVLWYNKDLFDKYNWKVPTSYDEIIALSKDIQSEGLVPFAFGASDCKPCWEWWASYALTAYLGPTKFYKVLKGDIPWSDPDVMKSFELLKGVYPYISDQKASALSFNDGWGLWGAQKAVMRMEGTWGFGQVPQYAKDFKYGNAPLPGWREGVKTAVPIGVGESIVIYAGTKHPDEAATVLDWLVSGPDLGSWAAKITGAFIPPVPLTKDMFDKESDPQIVDHLVFLADTLAKGQAGYVAWTAFSASTESYLWNNEEDMLLGRITIADYVKGLQEQFDKDKAAGKVPFVPAPGPDAP
jgi:raffinose/stachyose/melibiose transport system substrate-binding protein